MHEVAKLEKTGFSGFLEACVKPCHACLVTLSLALSRGDTSLPSWPLRSPETWIQFKFMMRRTGVFTVAWFAASRFEASGALLSVLGPGEALAHGPEETHPKDGHLWVWSAPEVGVDGNICLGFLHRLEKMPRPLSCLHTCPAGGALTELCPTSPSWAAPGAAFMPSVWRQLLWTFLLFYSVGLWFCLKAPVHRRKPAEEKAFFPRFPSFHCKFFFPFAICLLSLLPGISLLWLNVLKGYTLYLKTSWVTPLKFLLIRLNVKGFCIIILI